MEKDCNNCKFEIYNPDEIPCKDCGMDDREYWLPKPKTNADRIRAMSDKELAKFIGHNSLCDQIQNDNGAWCKKQSVCEGCLVEWLKPPAEGE